MRSHQRYATNGCVGNRGMPALAGTSKWKAQIHLPQPCVLSRHIGWPRKVLVCVCIFLLVAVAINQSP